MTWVGSLLRSRRSDLERDLGVRLGKTLGCGSFGCAIEARAGHKDLVLKLTVDRDEVRMWEKLLGLIKRGRVHGRGLVAVRDVGEIIGDVKVDERTADYATHGLVLRPNPEVRAYAILRDPIDPVSKGDDDRPTTDSRAVIARYGAENWGLFVRAVAHVFAAGRIYNELRFSAARPGVRKSDVVESIHRFVHEEVVVDVRDIDTEKAALEELSLWIGALHRLPFARDLSETLAECLAAGVVFADLKLSNLGWRAGEHGGKRQVLIFDVGGTPVP